MNYPKQPIQRIRILLAGDDTLIRAGIRSLLEKLRSVEVVSEIGVGPKLLRSIKLKRPDVLLIEVGAAGWSELDLISQAVRQHVELGVLVLSSFAAEEFVNQSLKAGACGYLLKRSTIRELNSAIRAVARRKLYVSPTIAGRFKGSSIEYQDSRNSPFDRLTPRQQQILKSIAESRNTKEIASLMKLSPKTVAFHRVQLMQRLNIDNVPGLVRYAIRMGLVSP